MKVFRDDRVANFGKYERLYFCCKCVRFFKTLSHFIRYRSTCEPVLCYRCKVCGKKYKTFAGAAKHSFKPCVRQSRRYEDGKR